MSEDRQAKYAKRILAHYLKSTSSGEWNWENVDEVHGAIDDIIKAAQAPLLKRIKVLEAKFEELEAKENTEFMTELYKTD